MYFEAFPRIEYTNVLGGDTKTVVNILKRIGARSAVKTNLVLFQKYQIRGNESPEHVAFNVYGDAMLHWVILLVNDIYDRYHQWPMNVNQFQSYITDTIMTLIYTAHSKRYLNRNDRKLLKTIIFTMNIYWRAM